MSKVILQGHILVPNSDLKGVLNELPIHIKSTKQESACLVFEVTQDTQNQNRFYVYEEFASREAFDKHQQRVKNSNWGKVASQVERHYQISEL